MTPTIDHKTMDLLATTLAGSINGGFVNLEKGSANYR